MKPRSYGGHPFFSSNVSIKSFVYLFVLSAMGGRGSDVELKMFNNLSLSLSFFQSLSLSLLFFSLSLSLSLSFFLSVGADTQLVILQLHIQWVGQGGGIGGIVVALLYDLCYWPSHFLPLSPSQFTDLNLPLRCLWAAKVVKYLDLSRDPITDKHKGQMLDSYQNGCKSRVTRRLE